MNVQERIRKERAIVYCKERPGENEKRISNKIADLWTENRS